MSQSSCKGVHITAIHIFACTSVCLPYILYDKRVVSSVCLLWGEKPTSFQVKYIHPRTQENQE